MQTTGSGGASGGHRSGRIKKEPLLRDSGPERRKAGDQARQDWRALQTSPHAGGIMPDSYGSTTGAGKQGASAAEFSVSISFLKQLRSNGPWVLTAILPDGGAPTITKTVHAAREVEAFLHEYNGKRNIYYSTNPTKTELTKKASKADDPPPLKWSDLRYVFDIQEDCNGKEAIQA